VSTIFDAADLETFPHNLYDWEILMSSNRLLKNVFGREKTQH